MFVKRYYVLFFIVLWQLSHHDDEKCPFFLVLLCDSPENVLQRTYEAAEKVENKSNTLHHNVTTGMCYFAISTYGFSSVGLSVCLFVDNITQKVMNLLDK